MNPWDWIALAAILAGAGIALVHLLKSKKGGCGGDCQSCSGSCHSCSGCHEKK